MNIQIQNAKSHLEVATMTLAACGQLANSQLAEKVIGMVAKDLGLEKNIAPALMGFPDKAKIVLLNKTDKGFFEINPSDGRLTWVAGKT